MLTRALRSRRAFTLLELIVVLVVLGLLAAIAIPTYQAVIGRADERAETSTLEAIGRNAVAIAALDRESPPSAAHWQQAFDETPEYGAYSEGLSAQEALEVAVVTDPEDAPGSADKVFIWAGDADVSAVIAPSMVAEDRCAVASGTASTTKAALIDPTEFGADSGDPIEDQCTAAAALAWATDGDAPAPTTTTTTTAPAYPAGSPGAPVLNPLSSYAVAQFHGSFAAPASEGDSPIEDYTVRVVGPSVDISCDIAASDGWLGFDISDLGFYCGGNPMLTVFPQAVDSGALHTVTVTANNAQGSGAPATATFTPS